MDTHTYLEDLSNEIFFEIFDYLDALDIFTSFTSLNQRISSILKIIPLRIHIIQDHCRRQIEHLSAHLNFHAHQVTSLVVCDTIRDYSSTINLLFNRHNFINLESCVLLSINPSTKLENVLNKIKSSTRLVSFSTYQPGSAGINEKYKHELARMIFTNQSSSLRSVALSYDYDYLDLSNYSSIASNLISLNLCIGGLSSNVSIYSIFPILRLCHTVRYLTIRIAYINQYENNIANDLSEKSSLNNNQLPILKHVIYLNLMVLVICDKHSISSILHCVPNLTHFYFTLITRSRKWLVPDELLDGYVWQQMLDRSVPRLSKFEFQMSIQRAYASFDIDMIINSLQMFVTKYSNWNMVIDRWKLYGIDGDYAILRTLNYRQRNSGLYLNMPIIDCKTFETRSIFTRNDHHLFYSNIYDLRLYITEQKPIVTGSCPLFQQITNLTIEMPMICSSLWNNLLNIANYGAGDDDTDKQAIVPYLTQFVYLHNITHIKFQPRIDISRWSDVQLILQACPNVINLVISTQLLFLSKLIDNPSLFPCFQRIKMIELVKNVTYFPPNSALKIVERFPSLNHIELSVFSFDYCVPVIDVFLTRMKDLSSMKIIYSQDTLLDNPFSRHYLITKRRQTFPDNIIDEDKVVVINTGEDVEIWLS